MNLKKSILVAGVVYLVGLASWELYWRSEGLYPGLEDNKALWAVQRQRVEKASDRDLILLGDSRILFDIQLDAWEEETGVRPIQLASAGTTPLPAFRDIVENTDFSGTIMISVHPGIFFSSTEETSFLWRRIKVRVDHYYDRTYADRLNHVLDIPLQNTFAFLRADDEDWTDDLDLKSLLANVKIGEREGQSEPPFYRFADIDLDRNVKMTQRTATDTAFANTIINVWKMFGSQDRPPPDKAGTSDYFLQDLEKFRSRGGQVILVRFPSSAGLKEGEGMAFPREDFWQEIVDKAQAPSYHYDDYQQLNVFFCPEWSHLSAEDAYTFTSELARIIQKDNVLK